MTKKISMMKLTTLIKEKGLKAEFCMSGGNCGTIYIGETDAEGYSEFAVGPSNYGLDEGYFDDICWGKDDQGESDPFFFNGDESMFTEENLVSQIIKDYQSSKVVAE